MKIITSLLTLTLLLGYPNQVLSQSRYDTYKEFFGKSTTKKCFFPNDSTLTVIIDDGNGNDFEQYFFYDTSGANVSIFYKCSKNPKLIMTLFAYAYSTDLKTKIDDNTFIDKKGNMVSIRGQENMPNCKFRPC